MTNSPLFLMLPRLHRELAEPGGHSPSLPDGAVTLWPGLPRPPEEGVFVPSYVWTPAQAAACLADFEQTGRAGAGGAPVLAFSVAGLLGVGGDLSPAERRALDGLLGDVTGDARRASLGAKGAMEAASASSASPSHGDDDARKAAAQRILLLAWLQERQLLELRALEQKVTSSRSALAGLLGEGEASPAGPESSWTGETPVASSTGGADDALLPPWRSVLAAAAVFLPASPAPEEQPARLLVTDRDMAETVTRLALEGEQAKPPSAVGLPAGFVSVRAPLGRVLGRGWDTPEASRTFLFLCPAPWATTAPEHA